MKLNLYIWQAVDMHTPLFFRLEFNDITKRI